MSAECRGIKAHWVIPSGTDIHGQRHERYLAYAVTNGVIGETLEGESVEAALRLVIGEAVVKRREEAP